MDFYWQILKLLYHKYIKKCSNGEAIKKFCENRGVVYIKLAQILANQNLGEYFTEEDRKVLASICDNCNSLSFEEIKDILTQEYPKGIDKIFLEINPNPVGSASISQVHKGVLVNGDIVAIKVKRKDITDGIPKEIKRIKSLMYRFGKYINFGNFGGGNRVLDLYLEWILKETDFRQEVENIKKYSDFASKVNGKIKDVKLIKVPRVYDELCTPNVIIMEYIEDKTISQRELSEEEKHSIIVALNSYLALSFYALLNDEDVVFHGDPHIGNIYIDKNGNIGFLDMGLIFQLSATDLKFTKEFFFAAFLRDFEKMYNLIVPYANMSEEQKSLLKEDIKTYCNALASKPVTSYFMDMVQICFKYEITPPDFLFGMAKAFVCLGGINNFSDNIMSGVELLQKQVLEYYLTKTINSSYNFAIKGLTLAPKVLEDTLKFGLVKGVTRIVLEKNDFRSKVRETLKYSKEMLALIKMLDDDCNNKNLSDDEFVKKK